MNKPRIYADFHNADAQGRLRLNNVGTVEDLAQQCISLREGMLLTLYTDDQDTKGQLDELMVDGVVSFSEEEHLWVAAIDWDAIQHASDIQPVAVNGSPPDFGIPNKDGEQTRRSP